MPVNNKVTGAPRGRKGVALRILALSPCLKREQRKNRRARMVSPARLSAAGQTGRSATLEGRPDPAHFFRGALFCSPPRPELFNCPSSCSGCAGLPPSQFAQSVSLQTSAPVSGQIFFARDSEPELIRERAGKNDGGHVSPSFSLTISAGHASSGRWRESREQ